MGMGINILNKIFQNTYIKNTFLLRIFHLKYIYVLSVLYLVFEIQIGRVLSVLNTYLKTKNT